MTAHPRAAVLTYCSRAADAESGDGVYPTDNNGVLIELPSRARRRFRQRCSGSLIFGIGTQSNNGLGTPGLSTCRTPGQCWQHHHHLQRKQLYQQLHRQRLERIFLPRLPPSEYHVPSLIRLVLPNHLAPQSVSAQSSQDGTESMSSAGIGQLHASRTRDNLFHTQQHCLQHARLDRMRSTPPVEFDWGLSFFYGRNVFHGYRRT